jgi:hypothetical protein
MIVEEGDTMLDGLSRCHRKATLAALSENGNTGVMVRQIGTRRVKQSYQRQW